MEDKTSRIVLFVPHFPKISETFIVSKFLGLLDAGWDVSIVCHRNLGENWSQFPELSRPELRSRVRSGWPHRPRWLAGLLVPAALLRLLILVPAGLLRYARRGWKLFGWDLPRRIYLDAELIRSRPDILHFEFGALAAASMCLRDLLDCRLVVSFRGYDLNHVGLDKADYYQDVWQQADMVHFLGRDLLNRAHRRGAPRNMRHVLVPPAIDSASFSPNLGRDISPRNDSSERPIRILSVGRLDWKKGYEFGLEAVRLLAAQGMALEYRIVGDGEMYEALVFARHQLGLKDQVVFLGSRPRREVIAQLDWADLFLHAAVSEGFCNAVLEAQAMRLPVVCSDAGGLAENISDGETGFIVPRRRPDLLCDKLLLLARDPELRARMGRAGRNRVLKHFELSRQINAFDSLYRTLVTEWRGG